MIEVYNFLNFEDFGTKTPFDISPLDAGHLPIFCCMQKLLCSRLSAICSYGRCHLCVIRKTAFEGYLLA